MMSLSGSNGNERFPSTFCPRCGFPEAIPELPIVPTPVSYLAEFLTSNAVLPDSAYNEVARQIKIAEKGIALLEKRMGTLLWVLSEKSMEGLIQLLEELHFRWLELRDFVADHRTITAPVRRLPNELLAEIFLQGAQAHDSWDVWWLFPQVCRSWRVVALSMPLLWARIAFNGPSKFGPLSRGFDRMLLLQLERSADFPLTIDISRRTLREAERIAIFGALFPTARRWQNVSLRLNSMDVGRFRNKGVVSFPQLTKLSLSVVTEECPFSRVFGRGFFGSNPLPLLEELHYDAPGRPRTGPETLLSQLRTFPLPQIKKLHLSNQRYQLSDMINVLRGTPNIVEASFHYCYMRRRSFVSLVVLSDLVSLYLEESDTAFLSSIVAPALQRLTLRYHRSPEPSGEVAGDVLPLISAGTSLTHLALHHCLAFDEKLLNLLAQAPHIRNLLVEHPEFIVDPDFVKALTCGLGGRNLVPELISLELAGCFRCSVDLLVEILKSRSTPGPLRCVGLRDCGGNLPDDMHDIFRNEGLKLTWLA